MESRRELLRRESPRVREFSLSVKGEGIVLQHISFDRKSLVADIRLISRVEIQFVVVVIPFPSTSNPGL